MAGRDGITGRLIEALRHARAGAWDDAHKIVQAYEQDAAACWLHAVLHKIEGDAENARYWYRRCDRDFDAFQEIAKELDAIERALMSDGDVG